MSQKRHEYDTGAVRSADCEQTRYDLISPIGMEALARTYAEGAQKFGVCNWENGMPVTDLLNHAIAHIYKFLGGNRDENHLGHATWNLIGAIHSLEKWPELNRDLLRGPNCEAPAIALKGAVKPTAVPPTQPAPTTADIESLRAALQAAK